MMFAISGFITPAIVSSTGRPIPPPSPYSAAYEGDWFQYGYLPGIETRLRLIQDHRGALVLCPRCGCMVRQLTIAANERGLWCGDCARRWRIAQDYPGSAGMNYGRHPFCGAVHSEQARSRLAG